MSAMTTWDRIVTRLRGPQGARWAPPEGEYIQRDFEAELAAEMARWCPDYKPRSPSPLSGSTEQWDLGGVDWLHAPVPPERHECYVHTYAYVQWFTRVERCACGGVCFDHRTGERHHWLERNARTGYQVGAQAARRP